LTRNGVGKFLLIDDDILLRANLVRNELDWRDVGQHKVDAVSRKIRMINPAAECTVRRVRISGQECAEGVDEVLTAIAECDVIIDATANPLVFNLLSYVAKSNCKSMVWLEVFEGGIGGLVARSRANIDPSPQTIRAGIYSWCAAQDQPWPWTKAGDYAGVDTEGRVFVADDADVSVIAAHATRMATDILVDPTGPNFPSSVYMIGLRQGWIFEQPFETFPIDIKPTEIEPVAVANEEMVKAGKDLIQSILEKSDA